MPYSVQHVEIIFGHNRSFYKNRRQKAMKVTATVHKHTHCQNTSFANTVVALPLRDRSMSADTVCPTCYRTWHFSNNRLAGGLLLHVTTIRRTTDTHYRHTPLHFSHNERTPFQISLQKEMPGSVASGTPYIIYYSAWFF